MPRRPRGELPAPGSTGTTTRVWSRRWPRSSRSSSRRGSDQEREAELGDLLFSVVNAARWLGVDAEGALRHANARFYARFVAMEKLSLDRGLSFADLPMNEKDALWEEAKSLPTASEGR